ncbi:membrane protein insertase YidC [Rubrobacter marinus]|uniref:Membrane protein insertase YidC n=1 Tax=Rubrobacter marinus TaxID=2653852 RepID=A0A6G8Q2B9_9ACTN|nr:membrane protein insertase YidC [Rubrobacter marinus]QIN80570.1 membrane protein insertase YidC [Rubrobacter marinus]
MINFLERVFSPLTNLLGTGLEFFHAQGLPWWLSIALLTIVVRTLLFPLTLKQVKSMRAMQDLKPEMDRLRAKYKDNRQKQQEELMNLYQERQVNPLGGCLPLLVQMPIFITMFYVIRGFGEEHPDFVEGGILWFQDLTQADPFYILPVVSAVTMLAASEITAKNLEPQQRWMMRILPVVFTVFLLTFPAGLFMYWITSNLVTLVQNYLIYNHGPGKKVPAAPDKEKAPAQPAPRAAKNQDSSAQEGNGRKATQVKQPSTGGRKRKRRR